MNVFWMEEPMFRGDYKGMATLRQETDVRIAGGELTRELYEFRTLIEQGRLDVLQPDAVSVGGITGLRRVAHMANEFNLVFTPHTWGNGIGLIGNAHLVAGCVPAPFLEFPDDPPEWSSPTTRRNGVPRRPAGMEFPDDPPEWSLDRRDFILTEPIVANADGWLILSDKPGFGIELDEERLRATRFA
jgi:L-alanine-DL-glutamate epimerase-like enolase superfamily enzyme